MTRDASSVFRGGVGHAIFVMEKDGTFYASKYQRVGEFHHSSLVAGRPVAAAGEIGVVDGTLISFQTEAVITDLAENSLIKHSSRYRARG